MSFLLTKPLHRLLHVSRESRPSQRPLQHSVESAPLYGCHPVQIGAFIRIWSGPKLQRLWFSDLPLSPNSLASQTLLQATERSSLHAPAEVSTVASFQLFRP